jgi:hypothetical protein
MKHGVPFQDLRDAAIEPLIFLVEVLDLFVVIFILDFDI